MLQSEFLVVAFALVVGTIFLGAISGVLVRYTARFTMGQSVKLNSAIVAGIATIGAFSALGIALSVVATRFERPQPYFFWLFFVGWFLVAGLINQVLIRKADSARLSYGDGCRVQLVPIAAILAYYFLFAGPRLEY